MKQIVLLHGWGASAGKLELLEHELEKLNWVTLNLDLPGFGIPPANRAWSVDDYADYVLKQTAKKWADNNWVVFGHSFGGRVAIKLAAWGKVSAMVLCAPGGLSRPGGVKRVVFRVMAKLGKVLGLQRYQGLLYKMAREHDYEKVSGVMRETFKLVVEEDLKPELEKIKVPALILWGEQDRMVPSSDGVMANEKIANSKLVLVANQGHKLPYEQPRRVAQEIGLWYRLL